jgi:hypothetical protein
LLLAISLITGALSAIFILGFIIQEYIIIYTRFSLVFFTEWGFFAFVSIWLITHRLFLKENE